MQEDQLRELLKKYEGGKCSAEEIALLEGAYLDWNEVDKVTFSEQQLVNARKLMWNKVVSHTKPAVTVRLWPRIAAAAVILIVGFGLVLYYNSLQLNTIVYFTKAGEKKTYTLPDGSIVKLNGKSSISFSKDFNQNGREVNLIGEAYFTVVHNAIKPFIVQTKSLKIKDLGTIFNVKAYGDDQYTEASLIEGAIELTTTDRKQPPVHLLPKQKVVVANVQQDEKNLVDIKNTTTKNLQVTHITSNPKDKSITETDWVNNRLTFSDESFGDIAKRLERWYNVKISFVNNPVKDFHFVATFDNEPLTEVLAVLKSSRDFNYRKEGDLVIIY